MTDNPFGQLRRECLEILQESIARLYPGSDIEASVVIPPNPDLGELASSVPFELAKKLGKSPIEIAEEVVNEINESRKFFSVRSIEAAGNGYINFRVDLPKLAQDTIEAILALDEGYGQVKAEKPIRIMVEHTSVNPIHPIHIGQARNPIIGDSVARLLRIRGHQVSTHFYIDDMGRQTAILAYAYDKLDRPRVEDKADRFMGKIYSLAACILETQRLGKELTGLIGVAEEEAVEEKRRELEEWASIGKELAEKYPDLFSMLAVRMTMSGEDPEKAILGLIQRYEMDEVGSKNLLRNVCGLTIRGFMETLDRIGIRFDSWDWESEISWSGKVREVFEGLKSTTYVSQVGGVFEFDANQVAEDFQLRKNLAVRKENVIPPLTLARLDGTTLYTTRDMAYSLWKFERADKVVNVIGAEQSLAQLQLKLGLYALGYGEKAENITHLAYGLVELPGFKMSSRRGRYITLDQVIDEAIERAFKEVTSRSPDLPEDEKNRIAEIVGIGAIKYALIAVDPTKNVTFTWDKVLNFEMNSAPFVQYAYARTSSILNKFKGVISDTNYKVLNNPLEKSLILQLSLFPEVLSEASENLRPNMIAEYCNYLALRFNSFYASLPVIQADSSEVRDARISLVRAVRITIRNSLQILGIGVPERM
jgi:arginyl-tRNA synthetase